MRVSRNSIYMWSQMTNSKAGPQKEKHNPEAPMHDSTQETTSAPTAVPLQWRTETTTDVDIIVVEESYGVRCGIQDRRISRRLREFLLKKRLCWYPTWGRCWCPSFGTLLGTTADALPEGSQPLEHVSSVWAGSIPIRWCKHWKWWAWRIRRYCGNSSSSNHLPEEEPPPEYAYTPAHST